MIKKLLFIGFIIFLTNNSFADNVLVEQPKSVSTNTKISNDYYKNYNSIMFSIDDINKILKTFPRLKYLSEFKDSTGILQPELMQELEAKQKSLFNFGSGNIYIYLNSIMYGSKNNWSIWINGNKITNLNNNSDEIKVLEVFPSLVKLAWTFDINQWEVINPNKIIPESNYSVKDDKITLIFSLSPNQSFLPITNQIIEGKIKETQIIEEKLVETKKPMEKSSNGFDNLFF
ncbi:MAG TPA: hypothetical protein VLL98_04590 [Rickettsiales bacterium]|nr:hypothetical protein [Rickettsiales bacterium]